MMVLLCFKFCFTFFLLFFAFCVSYQSYQSINKDMIYEFKLDIFLLKISYCLQ